MCPDPQHHPHAARRRPGAQPTADDHGWGVLEWVAFTWLLDWPNEREPSLSIDNDRALWTFEEEDDGRFEQWDKTIFVPPAGCAARVGDVMLHGDSIAPGLGSPNVRIGGKPALRACDSHVCSKTTPGPHAGSGFVVTYPRVEINGFAALRVGDYVDEGVHGKNPIVVGCPTVVIGPRPPQVECWTPGVDVGGRPAKVYGYRFRRVQLGRVRRKVVLGANLDGPSVRVEGTVSAAKLWAEESAAADRAKVMPKAPDPKPPGLETKREIVELS